MNAKVTYMMMKPTIKFFLDKWESILTNLRSLMGQIKKLGSATQGLFALQMSMHFKVQHVLFSVSNTTIKACFISTYNI